MDSHFAMTSTPRGQWVLAQLHGVLCDIFLGEISPPIESEQTADGSNRIGSEHEPQGIGSRRLQANMAAFSRYLPLTSGFSTEVQQDGQRVCLTVVKLQSPKVPRDDNAAESFVGCRLYAESDWRNHSVGAILRVAEISGPRAQISRMLSAFGVHPHESLVFDYIRTGNICGLQRMLSLRLLSTNDRDEDGNSLLSVCISRTKGFYRS